MYLLLRFFMLRHSAPDWHRVPFDKPLDWNEKYDDTGNLSLPGQLFPAPHIHFSFDIFCCHFSFAFGTVLFLKICPHKLDFGSNVWGSVHSAERIFSNCFLSPHITSPLRIFWHSPEMRQSHRILAFSRHFGYNGGRKGKTLKIKNDRKPSEPA